MGHGLRPTLAVVLPPTDQTTPDRSVTPERSDYDRPMRSLLALVLVAAPACRSAPEPVVRDAVDAAPAAAVGLPEEWIPWIGFDEWEDAAPVDWRAVLSGGENESGTLTIGLPGEGCLFEVVHRDGDALRRWHVLVRPAPDENGLRLGQARMNLDAEEGETEGRSIEGTIFGVAVDVTVAAEGRDPSPDRRAVLPLVPPRQGYLVTADESLPAAYEELQGEGRVDDEVSDRFAWATTQPMIALLMVFQGVQGHEELGAILREVVDAPSVIAIVLAGGLELSLTADLDEAERCACPVGDSLTRPGVRFPASITANGDPALEMEIYATEAVRPVHLLGGLVGLRAWLPGDRSRSVDLRLIGARRAAAK